MRINKKILTIIIGLLFVSWILFSLYLNNIWFEIESLTKYTENNIFILILWSLFIFSVRIFLFIPIWVLIILLSSITNNLLLTFTISIVWFLISALEIYYIWYLLNDDLKWKSFVKKIEKYTLKIKEKWFIYIFYWSIIPLIPVDLIYYAAWFEKYNIKKFILASVLWSIPIIFLYSYLWEKSELLMENVKYIAILILIIFVLYYIIKKWFRKK